MKVYERIRTIYVKELIDILRDHRTLIAMIVVPIVLYPLLMLGSIQAVSLSGEALQEEDIRVGVLSEEQGQSLYRVIQQDAHESKRTSEASGSSDEPEGGDSAAAPSPERFHVLPFQSRKEIEDRIADRSLHVGVILHDREQLVDAAHVTNELEFLVDTEDVRSAFARHRLEEVFERTRDRTVAKRKAQAGLPEAFDEPFTLEITDLSTPPSILGQVLPLILILMTITGAIYPAIDVTAGERERGTLESLMVSPVRVVDLVVGKFLVVTTVAVMGAALNLASVAATVYFGGFKKVIASDTALPLATMVVILLCLIPFAVLMSAIMIAVCCFARTFKEAQNYVTPVILAVLIPGGIAAIPTTRLDGVMLVMPVGNMVLLARDLLMGAAIPLWQIAIVLLSTTLYAGAAVALAASIFGRESVVFADAGSWRTALSRRLMRPAAVPSLSMGLLVTALLFPLWFFLQAAYSPPPGESAMELLFLSAWTMPMLFVVLPAAAAWYGKIDLRTTFALHLPSARYLLAAILIGTSAFVPAHWINVAQQEWVGLPKSLADSAAQLAETIRTLPVGAALFLLAALPALCEELLFRGFLLNGLRSSAGKATAIIVSALIFGVFHFILFKFPVTIALGIVLGLLCVQSRSILPPMIAHFLHNAIGVSLVLFPEALAKWGVGGDDKATGLSMTLTAFGLVVFVAGLALLVHPSVRAPDPRPATAARP